MSGRFLPNNLAQLEENGIITLKSPKEFYFLKDVQTLEKAIRQYSDITSKAIEIGKSGLRFFTDVHIFFHCGNEDYLVELESLLSPSFDFPLTCVCAYDLKDVQGLSLGKRKLLFDHHNHHLINNIYKNIIASPTPLLIEHIVMFSETPSHSRGVIPYLVEGLHKGQLCVYHSMHNIVVGHQKTILSQIAKLINYNEKNLMIIGNSDRYFVSAACDNLNPFEDLKKLITQIAISENKKDIRIVTDFSDFLFNYKHFDQCFALEEWWEHTIEEWKKNYGLNVSIICLFVPINLTLFLINIIDIE